MTARALMIQGTGSDVGKSTVVAGLCRGARRRGIDGAPEGARRVDGRVEGTYVHGLFANDAVRRAWLRRHGREGPTAPTAPTAPVVPVVPAGLGDYGAAVDAAIDELADGLEAALDVDALLGIAR